jgi:signal transduction histidine kinase
MSEQLDLRTVIKAGQALSGEIRVANYLERLMDVVVENAGAERGYLVAEEDGRLVVEARALPESAPGLDEKGPDEGPVADDMLPTGILGFVARTGETVVANDPAESGAFVNDPYVRSARPRSVLCLPLINHGKRVGLLYLENRLVADAFTPDRVELLELLSTQAAISVENGRLYSRLESYSQSLEDKVAERTGELAEKNVELERVLEDLRASQRQLVHTAKMASLGELTAGIAHEIKNPLNFINNFAEVSVELLGELREELQRVQDKLPGEARAEMEELAGMVGENLQRIAGHGKRADGIIAGMLFHSRSGSGDLQAADLNDLVDLALNLAFHGLRAQNAAFNAKLTTDFDVKIGEIEILPQDLSRALLNIFNNGLQSVHSRSQAGEEDYKPELRVETRDLGDAVEIFIRDNGLGLSEEHKDRIFQPFFTTKAAGEGTGLGLSLTYEIVTEGHGGTIAVEGREGEYAAFRIRLPKEREPLDDPGE